jgi:hypothetical protein
MNISLACAAVGVLIGSSTVQAHDIYSHLVDKWGGPCCDVTDCRPAPFKVTARGVEMLVAGRWVEVPPDVIQYRSLTGDAGTTGGGHWCGSTDWGFDGTGNPDFYGVTRCAVLPPNLALIAE